MQSQGRQTRPSNLVPSHISTGIKTEPPPQSSQDASHFFLAAQQRFDTGSHSPLSASASADQPGSGYQSSSAQSASGDPMPDGSAPSTWTAASRRPSEGHRSQKHRWSAEETQALVDGCNKHGVGNWKKMLSDPELSGLFSDRTAGDLKDRFRTYFPDAYHEMYPNAKTHLSKAVRARDAQGKSIFEKGKTKERRPFTPDEDAALRTGYQQYGSHWALIAKNPIFNGQRRAIDLRDRFRNAFPEDYERAGFKPRPSKAKKDRGPSAAKPGQGRAGRASQLPGTLSDQSLSEGAWRASEYPLSDTTSDGHLTDHGNLTDYSYFTDQGNLTDHGNLTDGGAEQVLSGPSSGASSALGRSNSMGGGTLPRQMSAQMAQGEPRSFGQVLALQQQQQQLSGMQSRPPFMSSSNTAPLPLRASDMVTGQSIHSLFEQLQQASLEGPGTSSETSSIRERATPPSASESDIANQQQLQQLHQQRLSAHGKAASADDARRQAGKQGSHDRVSHKRRSHVTRTGKNSALERLPSVHGHLHHMQGHGHVHAHAHVQGASSRPHSQSSSQHHSPAGGAIPVQADPRLSPLSHSEAPQPDVLAWLNPNGHPMLPDSALMDIDDQRAVPQGPSSWSAYSSSASDISGTSLNASASGNFLSHQPNLFGSGMQFTGQSGMISPPHPGSAGMMMPGMGAASDSSASSAAGSRQSSTALDTFGQQQQQQQQLAQSIGKAFENQQPDMRGNFAVDQVQSFLNPLTSPSSDPTQWNVDWDLGSISDSGLQTDDVNELLASLPLSHHPWAGDLHHGATATGAGDPNDARRAYAGANANPQISSSQGSGRGQPETAADLSSMQFLSQSQGADDAMLRQLNALSNPLQQQQHQLQQHGQQQSQTGSDQVSSSSGNEGGVSFATVTYGDPLVREEREGSPDSLELQREQTFTAKDVGTRFVRDNFDERKDEEESDDDQRRRSTDTLRRAEGALEAALESVEDTRALAFAQQFQRDVDSDEEDSDQEADEDGYEEDEEDDNEPDYEPEYNFQQVLDDLQASDAGVISSDFFDGPFGDNLAVTPGAPNQQLGDLDVSNMSQYQQRSQHVAQMQSSHGGSPAAAAASMNQMWNSGQPLSRLPQLYMRGDASSGNGQIDAGWTPSSAGNSTGYVISPAVSNGSGGAASQGEGGSGNASPGQGGGGYT